MRRPGGHWHSVCSSSIENISCSLRLMSPRRNVSRTTEQPEWRYRHVFANPSSEIRASAVHQPTDLDDVRQRPNSTAAGLDSATNSGCSSSEFALQLEFPWRDTDPIASECRRGPRRIVVRHGNDEAFSSRRSAPSGYGCHAQRTVVDPGSADSDSSGGAACGVLQLPRRWLAADGGADYS